MPGPRKFQSSKAGTEAGNQSGRMAAFSGTCCALRTLSAHGDSRACAQGCLLWAFTPSLRSLHGPCCRHAIPCRHCATLCWASGWLRGCRVDDAILGCRRASPCWARLRFAYRATNFRWLRFDAARRCCVQVLRLGLRFARRATKFTWGCA